MPKSNYTFAVVQCTIAMVFISTTTGQNKSPTVTQSVTLLQPSKTHEEHQARSYLNPLAIEKPPATCDLTTDICDLNCCDDKDCTSQQIESFLCTESRPPRLNNVEMWRCYDTTDDDRHFWFPFLCYIKNNSPYLGEYFTPPVHAVESASNFKNFRRRYTYEINNNIKFQVIETEYKINSPIKIAMDKGSRFLYLPSAFADSIQCVFRKPVSYLQTINTKCLREISPTICLSDIVSVENYIQLKVWNDGIESEIVHSKELFFCYHENSFEFKRREILDMPRKRNWIVGEVTGAYKNCTLSSLKPFYDNSTGICHNVLLYAQFQFKWNGSTITDSISTFRFASIPTSISLDSRHHAMQVQLLFTQHYEVTYDHETRNNRINDSHEPDVTTLSNQRSGMPGYKIGRPLIVGTMKLNNETNKNESWNWLPGYIQLFSSKWNHAL